MLCRLQQNSFDYFQSEVNPANGLVRDKTTTPWPSSIAATGMGLSVYTVGVERGFISRQRAIERTLATLRFFASSDQSGAVDSSGYKGFYFHFLDMQSGRRAWNSELSSIDTALLMAGMLTSAAYFDRQSADEVEIRQRARLLYERVDWAWMLHERETLCHGWQPETGFLPFHWQGYDEALILYLLALGSPTHPIAPSCYTAWCASYDWKRVYDLELLYAGPLFIHQMSHIWCDFRGIQDGFMRQQGSDYFENSRRATLVQQQYAMHNPQGFSHVGEFCWGVTASDGPGNTTKTVNGIKRQFFDYVARGVPFGPDDGTLAPWAVAASLPFAPKVVADTLAHMSRLKVCTPNPYGFKASFNPVFHEGNDGNDRKEGNSVDDDVGWVSPYHFGINEGPTVLMIENQRSEMIWSLMKKCEFLRRGLLAAGFNGGWLQD